MGPTNGQVLCGILGRGIVGAGIEAGIGAGAAALFTTMSPGAGAVFGAVYGVVSLITEIGLAVIAGPKFAEKNCLAAFAINVIVAGGVTVGVMAAIFTAAGVAFTAGSLFILVGGMVAISMAIYLACCCCALCVAGSIVAAS